MKRFLLFLLILLSLDLLVRGYFWYWSLSVTPEGVASLLPARAQGIVALGEDASEQGVRAWLEELFYLRKIPPAKRVFIRNIFPSKTVLVALPAAAADKIDWLLIGDLGGKAPLVRISRFWWEKQPWFGAEKLRREELADSQVERIYTLAGKGGINFFLWRNYLVVCSSKAARQTVLDKLRDQEQASMNLPKSFAKSLYTTDADRDGNLYLDNQQHFWSRWLENYPWAAAPQVSEFLDNLQSVRGNFDFVDLNRLRLVLTPKFPKEYLPQGQKLLNAWGTLAEQALSPWGIELEYYTRMQNKDLQVTIYPHRIGRYFAYLENARNAELSPAGSSFQEFTLAERNLTQLVWSLKAERASVDKSESVIECENLDFAWFDADSQGQKAHLTARSGVLTRQPLLLKTRGQILLKTAENTLETEELTWDNKLNLITTEQAVRITRQEDILTGVGLRATPDLKSIKILKDVKITLKEIPRKL